MKIKVNAYSLTPSEIVAGTAGSYGSAVLQFEFGEGWEGLIKKASFFLPEERPGFPATSVVMMVVKDEVPVPDEIMETPGEYPFVLSGHGTERTLISVTGRITVLPTATPAVTPPGSPTPSEMDQIYAMVQSAVKATEGAAKAAEDAGKAVDGALSAAKQAENAGKAAMDAAKRAMDAAKEAGSSVVRAEVNEEGHLILTMSGGGVQDAGSVQGHAVTGEYIGTGYMTDGVQEINIGFRPGVLLLSRSTFQTYLDLPGACAIFADGVADIDRNEPHVKFRDEGFTVYQPDTLPAGEGLNEYGILYRFVALAESIPLSLFENPTADRFGAEDGEEFQSLCREVSPPGSFGQFMVGPGGRLFVSILGHSAEKNKYGAWFPVIDDTLAAAAPAATTYSAEKIGEIASGLSKSIGNLGSSLSAGISAIGSKLDEKAPLVDGCVKMNGCNVMGYVKTLAAPEDDPSDVSEPGFYAITTLPSEWQPNALPPNTGVGLLEVLPSFAGLGLQRFYSTEGDCYFRSNDLVHATGWRAWQKLT